MTHDFTLLHRTGPERFELPGEVESFSFTTCLRHIVIADDVSWAPEGSEVLQGEAAYRFLLEVICGLHSPLVGETEVAGQFKNTVAEFSYPATPWGSLLAKTFKGLFEDAKRVRDAHLKDLGSQSYGSVLRREVRGLKEVHILGAGHLVKEILPWVMKDGLRLTVHARNPEKARAELPQGITVVDLDQAFTGADVLVIAAPVSAEFVSQWTSGVAVGFVADLRADSSTDKLINFNRVLELGEFMSRLDENQALVRERKRLALAAISNAALERARTVEYRPFGWEDVCA